MMITPIHTRRVSAATIQAGEFLALFSGNRTTPKFVKVTRAYTSDGMTTLNTEDRGTCSTVRVPSHQLLQIRA